jgi:hypothetical protein
VNEVVPSVSGNIQSSVRDNINPDSIITEESDPHSVKQFNATPQPMKE